MVEIQRDELLRALAGAPDGREVEELAALLEVGAAGRRPVRELLLELTREGVVTHSGRRWALARPTPDLAEPTTGVLRRTAQGTAFVNVGEAYEEVLVADDDQGPALDGDTVQLALWDEPRRAAGPKASGATGRPRTAGRVVHVVARGRVRLTGVLRDGRPPLVEPDDPRLPRRVELVDVGPARPGQAVLATITDYPARQGDPLRACVTRVLGEPGLLLTEVARSVAGAGVEEEFPRAVRLAAEATPRAVRDEDRAERLDLRALPLVTIDPQTARDFDDAVAVEPGPGGAARVWVAVADVSAYVAEGSVLDEEARRRGLSLYLPDRAIPMLPPALSSGICSLVPGEDRLAMVVRFDVSPRGEVSGEELAAAVIHSHGRLDYHGVAAALGGDLRGKRAAYREHLPQLESLAVVARTLREHRLAHGSLDLDLPESQVLLDDDDPNRVRDIVEARGDAPLKRAYNLIEELMVAANEAVGRSFLAAGAETIWRVHAPPTPEALARLGVLVGHYGLEVDPRRLSSARALGRLLRSLQGHAAERPLSYLVLRALKQAVYGVTNIGHFGLASAAYLHFTSPIRRYPDLHVHRLAKEVLRAAGRPAGAPLATRQTARAELLTIARESTAAERRLIEVERDVRALYAASLMRDRIGDEADGTIVGVTSFGLFVSLDRPFVEGLVRLDALSEWVDFDPESLRLVGQRSGRAYALGDRLRVRVASTSVARRQIDLEPVREEGDAAGDRGRRRGSKLPGPAGGGKTGRRERGPAPRGRGAGRGTRRRG